jgi:hypothetical protein
MTKRELIKTALLSVVAKVGGVLGIQAAEKMVPNPMFGVKSYTGLEVTWASVHDALWVNTGYTEVSIERHPNWETLRDKYGAFVNDAGEWEFPQFIPDYKSHDEPDEPYDGPIWREED